jgi:hypothetical protein
MSEGPTRTVFDAKKIDFAIGGIVTFAEGRGGFLLTGDRMRRICFERNDS